MKISFLKLLGDRSLNIDYFWQLSLTADRAEAIVDTFIPELFFDYFYVKEGNIRIANLEIGAEGDVARQVLKTLYTRSLHLTLTPPLVLFGARLSLEWAEMFWEPELPANQLLTVDWVQNEPADLEDFSQRVIDFMRRYATRKNLHYLLTPQMEETDWLMSYSPRHKRRLLRNTYGLTRKELLILYNVHTFLTQTCDFDGVQQPHIIEYVNDEVFYDQPHLNHTFRNVTGLSPLEYFAAGSLLQDNLMAASYNENPGDVA